MTTVLIYLIVSKTNNVYYYTQKLKLKNDVYLKSFIVFRRYVLRRFRPVKLLSRIAVETGKLTNIFNNKLTFWIVANFNFHNLSNNFVFISCGG